MKSLMLNIGVFIYYISDILIMAILAPFVIGLIVGFYQFLKQQSNDTRI